jgi:hypothetical protein
VKEEKNERKNRKKRKRKTGFEKLFGYMFCPKSGSLITPTI